MKKFLVLFLIFTVAAVAFAPKAAAQFSWRLDTGFNTGLLSWNIPTGERAEKIIMVDNNKVPNSGTVPTATDTGGYNPVNGRGDYTYTSGGLDVFSYGKGTWLRANELRLTIGYSGEVVEFYSRALLDELVRAELVRSPSGTNSTTGSHSFVMGSGRTPNWNDFLRYSFDEYYLKGNFGFLSASAGNTPDRGKVEGFGASFTEDVLRTIMVEHYGVNTPTADADFSGNGQDLNNFRTRPSTEPGTTDPYEWVMPYLAVGARLNMAVGKVSFPFFVQLATDPGNNSGIAGDNNYKRYNGSVRLSFEKIADAVTLDTIYRFRGGDPGTLDNYDPDYNSSGTLQPDGRGSTAHAFGLYANVLKVPKLGIGLGYSGYIMSYEDDKNTLKTTTGETITRTGPLYSGIDLRLQFTGLNNITITSINNVSFASANPSSGNSKFMGVLGSEDLDYFTIQGWLALYNALGLDWKATESLTVSFQIGNRYGLLTTKESVRGGGVSTIERSRMQLGGGAYVAYQFNRFICVQGGFAFRYLNDSYSNTAPGSQNDPVTRNASGGSFDIAIPIMVNMVFGNR